MLITIIIPNYNHDKYLDARIQSVLNQTYKDFEIIILDDCSTDKSREVIEKYRNNEHVSHIVYNETNSGSTFKQWEKGIELAKGELIWIAESDDLCEEYFLEKMVPLFSDNKVVLTFSRSMQIDGNNRKLGIYPSQVRMKECFSMSGKDFISDYLSKYNIVVNASSALIKKSVICGIDKDYYLYKGCGDWLFWIYIAEKGYVCFESETLNYFRQHLNNTTGRLDNMGNNPKEVHKIYKYLVEKQYFKNTFRKIQFRVSRLASYLQRERFSNKSVLYEVMDEWKFVKTDYMMAYLYIALRKLNDIRKNR